MASAFSYQIILTDAAQVAALQALYPTGIAIPPAQASAVYGAPIYNVDTFATVPPVIIGGATWEEVGIATADPVLGTASPILTYGTVEEFTVQWTSSGHQTTTETTFYWVGYFFLGRTTAAPPASDPTIYIGHRRWIEGFEIPTFGEGSTDNGSGASRHTRAAARIDGMGFAYRNPAASSVVHALPVADRAAVSWERFYLRLHTLPVGGSDPFWACFGTVDAGSSVVLLVDVAGTISAYNKGNAVFPGTLIGTTGALALETWYRVDLRIQYNSSLAPPDNSFKLYLNGTLVLAVSGVGGVGGLKTVQLHNTSMVGDEGGSGQHGLECDLDDWISAAEVTVGTTRYPGIDLTSGSHIKLVNPTGPNPANWTGDWRELLGNPQVQQPALTVMATTTSVAVLTQNTDYADQQFGCAAFSLAVFVVTDASAGGPNGTLQASTTDGAVATGVITLVAGQWKTVFYTVPDGTALPLPLRTAMTFSLTKDVGVANIAVRGLLGAAEFTGVWDASDGPATLAYPPAFNQHNWPYPLDNAATSIVPPLGMVACLQGTYIGNGTGQDIPTDAPVHWVFIRNVTTGGDGVCWYTGMIAAHGYVATHIEANRLVRAFTDQATQQSYFSVIGASQFCNIAGSTYQWVAVSDPTFRFLINGMFSHLPALAASVNPLVDAAFTPDCGFFFVEAVGASAASLHYYKGPGYAASAGQVIDATATVNIGTLGAGVINGLAALHQDVPDTAYSVWRKSDGQDTGLFDCGSYVGNGGGARVIPLALNGMVPMFVLVIAHAAGGNFFRDPSHAGAHSQSIAGVDSSTAITALGADSFTVGATLNGNLTTYDFFAISSERFPVPFRIRPGGPYLTPAPAPSTSCVNLVAAATAVLARLGDTVGVHWTLAEVERYLVEALRTYNALTQFYRNRDSFTSTDAEAFYDLPTVLASLRAYTVTDRDLITDLEYALMEPPTPSAWTGSSMFTLDDLTAAVQRRVDLFRRETGAVVTPVSVVVTPDAAGRIVVPATVLTIRRAAWMMADGTIVPLARDDEWSLQHYKTTWQTPKNPTTRYPTVYAVGATPPLTVTLGPPPTAQGTLLLLAVTTAATFDPETAATVLGIPDDWTWVVKWGALADLFGTQGVAYDIARSQHCQQRWAQGLSLATQAAVVLDAFIDNEVVQTCSVNDADKYATSWQTVSDAPVRVLLSGQNIVGLAPIPNDGGGANYAVTLDVIANMPVPTLLTDCINDVIDDAVIEAIYDYAEYLAMVKEGSGVLDAAQPLLERFFATCGTTLDLDQAQVPTRGPILQQTVQDLRVQARRSPPEPTES